MNPEKIIENLKQEYNRDLRKQIVKSVTEHENNKDQAAIQSSYNILNQIFSYVLSQLGWNIVQNSKEWDDTPLLVMKETFPKIETTQWYKEQELEVEQTIKLQSEMLQK
ncbi:MAG: hypothetical protein ABXS93_01395 [Sulfurimonas sp.]